MNCYYGAYLWSIVRNGAGLDPESDRSPPTDFARLLLSLEINGARTYWHMEPELNTNRTPSIYSEQFSENYMVGNIGMSDAICTTWFGTEPLYVHMINFLPVTAATGELFGKNFATVEYDAALASLVDIDVAWRGFVIAHHAISDPNAAWKDAVELSSPTLDAGLSKTQLLYWISTRQGFSTNGLQSSNTMAQTGQAGTSTTSDACELHELCAALSLTGKCCPTSEMVMLGCC